jgi:hypothetical protein
MPNPQQPELARTRRGGATPEKAAKSRARSRLDEAGSVGPVPEDNQPGHHPDQEQDKPTGPPPAPSGASGSTASGSTATATKPKTRAKSAAGRGSAAGKSTGGKSPSGKSTDSKSSGGRTGRAGARAAKPASGESLRTPPPSDPAPEVPLTVRFRFRFDPVMQAAALPLGVLPSNSFVEVTANDLTIRFGRWSLTTPLANVEGAEVSGPYSLVKVIGPPRLSIVDRGVTFATNPDRGVCIRFREAVPGALPFGLLRHPGATVTVEEPEALADALTSRR